MTKEEFTEGITAMTEQLYRVSCGLLRSEADREDAVQETILLAWEKLHTLKHEEFFRTWVVRILINECRGIGRQRGRVLPMDELSASVDEAAPSDEQTRELRRAVMALPDTLRLPVILHYVEGYGVTEAGKILGIPAGTVKSRLSRARKQLKMELEEAETR